MSDRPKFFDDLAGVAGGALSALAGLREEFESTMRARVDEAIRKLDLVRREEFDAVAEMASNARAGQERLETELAALQATVAALEARSPIHVSSASSSAAASAGSTSSAAFGSAASEPPPAAPGPDQPPL